MRDRNDSRASQSQVNNTYRLLPYKSVCASLLLGCHAPGLGAKEPMITAKSINRLGRQKGRIAIRLCSKRSPSPLQLRKVSIYAVKSVEWVAMAVAPLLRLQIGLLTPAPFCELIKFLAFQRGPAAVEVVAAGAHSHRHFRGRFQKFKFCSRSVLLLLLSLPPQVPASLVYAELKYPLGRRNRRSVVTVSIPSLPDDPPLVATCHVSHRPN